MRLGLWCQTAVGLIPSLTLVLDLEQGSLSIFTWERGVSKHLAHGRLDGATVPLAQCLAHVAGADRTPVTTHLGSFPLTQTI